MIIFVVLVHTCKIPCLHHGYLAVDVFFFISGYYLMRNFQRRNCTAVRYTWGRIRQFYLPYLLSLLFSAILRYKGLLSFHDLDGFLEKIGQFAFGLTLMEEIGPAIMHEHILLGSWYLSVLIIAGFLLYSLLEYRESLAIKVILPFICISGWTFLFTVSESAMNWSRVGAVSLPLLRGFVEMSAGALLYKVYTDYHDAVERRSTLVNVAAVFSFVLFICLMFTRQSFDKYLIVTIPWMVLGAHLEKSWMNDYLKLIHGDVFSRIGQYTIYVLFGHPPAILLVHWSNEHLLGNRFVHWELLVLDLIMSALASFALWYSCRYIKGKTQCVIR